MTSSKKNIYIDNRAEFLLGWRQTVRFPLNSSQSFYFSSNRIYNKSFDRDWFSERLFVTLKVRDQVGVQLQVSDLNFL